MGNLKCKKSQKRLIVDRNGRKFGTRCTTMQIHRVLLMPDSLSLVWGYSVHFAKCLILRFSKRYSFNSFHQISTKRHTKYHNQGLIWVISVLTICQKLKILWHFEIFINTGLYGA